MAYNPLMQQICRGSDKFNALDRSSVRTVRELLQAHLEQGGTLILTSHHDEDLDLLAQEIHEIDGGRLQQVR